MADPYDLGGVPAAVGVLDNLSQIGARDFETQRKQALLPGELAMQPAKLMAEYATGRYHNAQAGDLEQKLQMKKAMADAYKSGQVSQVDAAGTPIPYSQQLRQLANIARRVGDVDSVNLYEKEAVTQSGHEAQERARLIQERIQDRLMYKSANEDASRLLRGATSQQDMDDAAGEWEDIYKKKAPWRGLPYSSQLVQKFVDRGLTEAQSATRDYHNAILAKQKFDKEEAQRVAQENLRIKQDAERRKKEEDEQKARERKQGALMKTISADERKMITNLIQRDFPKLDISDPSISDFADNVAFQARKARLDSGGSLSPNGAAETAYQNAKGKLSQTDTWRSYVPGQKEKLKVNQAGSKQIPIEAQPGMKFEEGKYYRRNGRIGLYKGNDQWEVE